MPKRVIDFDAMWASDKLARCAVWARREYAWLYGLADCSGCFEWSNLRVVWGKVAAIRPDVSVKKLEKIFAEFQRCGLLFVWEQNSKRYGHWTGSDVPGRLPPPSWRVRLERLAPPVPADLLAEYLKSRRGGSHLNPRLEVPQAQNGERDSKEEGEKKDARFGETLTSSEQVPAGSEHVPTRSGELAGPDEPRTRDLPSADVLHEIWEQERGALPAVKAVTRDRLSKCQARLRSRSSDAEQFLREFRAAVRKASETPFLLGENDRGWRVSLDWFIANDTNYLKVLEGRYDGTQRTNRTRAAERRSATARALSRVFASAEELARPVQRALPAGDQRAECGGVPGGPGGPDGRAA